MRKTIVAIFFAFITVCAFSGSPEAIKYKYDLSVIEVLRSSLDDDKEELDWDRNPNSPHAARISYDAGVEIFKCIDVINLYEVWTEDGSSCLISTDEEKEFILEFFNLQGNYQVQFHTEEYSYIGKVSI